MAVKKARTKRRFVSAENMFVMLFNKFIIASID